ncbi:MAG: transcriptional regulator [Candidatus Moranbacteria bacterium]|nr:transcriptional regulator [Candidatus Moranbacteria bacterium]
MTTIDSIEDLAEIVKKTRKNQGLTQPQLAAAAGVGIRFIVDLEKGKPTCEIGKVFQVVKMLGINLKTDEEIK